MRNGWQTKKLGDVATLQRGFDLPTQERTAGIYPLVSSSGISDTHHKSAVHGPGVVTGRSGSIGNVFYIAEDFWPLNTVLYIKDFHGNDPRFVFHLLNHFDLRRFATGTGVPTLNRNFVHDELVYVPVSVPEQQRVAGLLDEVFACIATAKANAEKNLQNARALFESHLQSVFAQPGKGWVQKPFEDCIEDVKYTTKIQRKDFLDKGEFPVVSQEADFTNGFWNNAADVFEVARPVVIFGDHTKVLKYVDFDFVLGADGVKILPPKPFLNPKFFFYLLRSTPLKSLGYSRHYRLLKELQISYPALDSQSEIVKELDTLETETQRLASIYERKLAALEALKKSLLHQAFAGEL